MTMPKGYDYIIIGAGSSGCALAYRLVKNSDANVLLIEAGGRDTKDAIHSELLPDTLSLWGDPDVNWGYMTEKQSAMNDREIPIARGKVWGG
jgi:choline dehydrogenase